VEAETGLPLVVSQPDRRRNTPSLELGLQPFRADASTSLKRHGHAQRSAQGVLSQPPEKNVRGSRRSRSGALGHSPGPVAVGGILIGQQPSGRPITRLVNQSTGLSRRWGWASPAFARLPLIAQRPLFAARSMASPVVSLIAVRLVGASAIGDPALDQAIAGLPMCKPSNSPNSRVQSCCLPRVLSLLSVETSRSDPAGGLPG